MLVLTRKLQEKIQIGDNVTITVLQVKGRQVRLGIVAPRNVRVLRSELPREINVPMDDNSPQTTGEAEQDAPAVDPLNAATVQDTTRPKTASCKPHVMGRRFRIISQSTGTRRHAVAAVAIQ